MGSQSTVARPVTRGDSASGRSPEACRGVGDAYAQAAGLRDALGLVELPPGEEDAPLVGERAAVLAQLEDYVLPRLAAMGRPPLVVVGGPTGVGKSTLVNSLAGARVTEPGLRRPTTRAPVLVHHPDDSPWFAGEQVLPGSSRATQGEREGAMLTAVPALDVVAGSGLPSGVALLDTPDFDSVDDDNRVLAARLLRAADVWLFVTSAARYADQLPWQHLDHALARGASVVVVLNRVAPPDRSRVVADFRGLLTRRQIPDDRVFVVEHTDVDESGALPAHVVADIRAFLESLGSQRAADAAVRSTVTGALTHAAEIGERVAGRAVAHGATLAQLADAVERGYEVAHEEIAAALGEGSLLDGPLAAQWEELTAVPVTAPLAGAIAAVRRRVATDPAAAADLPQCELAVNLAVENLLTGATERAARRAAATLRASAVGAALLQASPEDLGRPSRAVRGRTPGAVGAWQRRVADAVRAELISSDLDDGADPHGLRAFALAVTVRALATPVPAGGRPGTTPAEGLHGLAVRAAADLAGTVAELVAAERGRVRELIGRWCAPADAVAAVVSSVAGVRDTLADLTGPTGPGAA